MKTLFKSVLSGFCFSVFGIGSLIVGLIVFPLIILFYPRKKQRQALVNTIRHVWSFFVALMEFCQLIKVEPLEHSDFRGKIIISNHPSLIDIVILISKIPNCICIVKSELNRNFFMKHIVRRVYLINDMDPDKLMDEVKSLLDEGFNLVVFPEGTRTTKPKEEIKLHRGVAHLAIHTNAEIIAFHIQNTPPILGKKQKWYQMGKTASIYKISKQKKINFQNIQNLSRHSAAKHLTEEIKNAIFP